jgi:hypothetical protein
MSNPLSGEILSAARPFYQEVSRYKDVSLVIVNFLGLFQECPLLSLQTSE